MKPPMAIDVGPYRYTVKVDEAAINKASVDAKDGLLGSHDGGRLVITLDPALAPDMMASVLIHELEHAILFQVGADEGLDQEQVERICNANSTLLLDMLRRNPKLVEHLTNGGRS